MTESEYLESIRMDNENTFDAWWNHNGIWDRQQASGIPYKDNDASEYLTITDDWWYNLTYYEKLNVYKDFFDDGESITNWWSN